MRTLAPRPRRILALLLLIAAAAAAPAPRILAARDAGGPSTDDPGPRYARGFDLERVGEATLLTVFRSVSGHTTEAPETASRYLLVERDAELPRSHPDATVIRTPVRSAVTLSSTYLPALEELGVSERIVGHDRRSWVYSPEIRARMRRGEIEQVGSGGDLDLELLLSLSPDVIFTYDAGTSAENPYPRLAETGLTVVTTAEYLERSPLGRSEWILFMAAFFDLEAEGRDVFSRIEQRYLELKSRTDGVEDRPSVFLNAPWGASWAMPEGANYSAIFLEHAGADYVFSDRGGSGTLFLDFETVLAEAGDAEYWLNPGDWESLAEGLSRDRRFHLFRAFREEQVYNNNARVAPGGGNDYFESGYLHAERVLSDLIAIFHPELMPGYELFYYRKLQ